MELIDALRTRRTVQRYTDEPLPDVVLDRALEAAHHAPCHKLTWPWRFMVLGPESRQQLVGLAVALNVAKKKMPPERVEARVRGRLGSASRLVIVSQVLDADLHRREEDYAAISCAIQNLMLSLHGDGFGSKWSTGGFTTDAETYQMCRVDPELERIVGCILMGRAADACTVPARTPLGDHVRHLP